MHISTATLTFESFINRLPFFIRRKLSLKAVAGCLDILERNGCKPFLAYGTALAVLRNKTIRFSHDPDCDIGIRIENWNPEVKQLLIDAGYKLEHELGTLDMGYELSFKKWGVKVDLFMFYSSGDTVWNCLWDLPDTHGTRLPIFHTYPSHLFEERKTLAVHNKLMPVPAQLETYIETVYGPEWQKPVIKWNWRTDHHCINKNFNPYES